MAILWPEELPCWLLDSHEGQDEDIYARTPVDYGTDRLRRMYPSVPQIRKAAIFLHGDKPRRFHEFFENDLDVGSRRFIAPFRDFSGQDRFFECEFVEPYTAEYVAMAFAARAWRVQCQFRLYGNGSLETPYKTPAALSARLGVRLYGSAKVKTHTSLGAVIGVRLGGVVGDNRLGDLLLGAQLGGRIVPASDMGGLVLMVAMAGRAQHG